MLLTLLSFSAALLHGQYPATITCTANAVPALVRQEGLTERVGDIILNCSGGPPAAQVTINLTLFLSTNITNKISQVGTQDVNLTIDTGAGPVYAGMDPVPQGPNSVAYNGLKFTLSNAGSVTLRFANLRAAVALIPTTQFPSVIAFFTANGTNTLAINNSPLTVAQLQRGMLASYASTFFCTASLLPGNISFMDLLNFHTRFASARFTEGYADSFQKGTRFFVRYSGFPAGSRLLVPDAVTGSSATTPTAAGDLGLPPSPGVYSAPGQLLLARVNGADPTGSGGTLSNNPPGTLNDVTLTGGSGIAVYEVVDSNPSLRESAQFPTFLALGALPDSTAAQGLVEIGFAPFSTNAAASATAPVPRFMPSPVPSDCATLADCNAAYFPRLLVDASDPLSFAAITGSAFQLKYVRINNTSGGALNWTAFITYKTGSGWITLDASSGINNATLRLDVHPENLKPGTYEATLTVDAGPLAGSKSLPVTLKVTDLGPPPLLFPTLKSYFNAASLAAGPLTPGSLASVFGQSFGGNSLQVTFDGIAAKVLFSNETQINLQVPDALAGHASAQMQITVDGRASVPVQVLLAASAPAIFPGAILNQDYSQNKPSNPAMVGSVIQIFLTGLPASGVSGVTGKIHDRDNLTPYYAGPAPGFIGVQQVNLVVPADLPATTTEVKVCASGVCTAATVLTIKQ